MAMRAHIAALALIGTLICGSQSACSPAMASAPAWAGTVDTLPNGAVWVSSPAEGTWTQATQWGLIEDLRIDQQTLGARTPFEDIVEVTQDRVGRLYALDRRAKQVRVFDRDGNPLRRLGRPGTGRGGLVDPESLEWGGDGRLWVGDPAAARYTLFDSGGRFVQHVQRPASDADRSRPAGFSFDGHLYEIETVPGIGPRPIGFTMIEGSLVVVDTFPPLAPSGPGTEGEAFDLRDPNGRGALLTVPFAPTHHWALDGLGGAWVGHSATYAITRRTLHGDTVMVVSRQTTAAPVELRERAAAIEALGEYRTHPDVDLTRIPSRKPLFTELLPAPDGRLWIMRETDGPGWAFDIFETDGRFLGTLPLPVEPVLGPRPRLLHDAVVFLARDSDGTANLRRLRIVRPWGVAPSVN